MSKTLYLHIGMPKCASTTIQNVLQTHADEFAAHGKFYGRPANDKTKEQQGNATRLADDFRNGKTDRVDDTLEFFLERDTDVILSSEVLVGLGNSVHAEALVMRAAEKGFDTQIICYVRRQDQWIESDYKQHVKGISDWCEGIEALIARRAKTHVLDYHWLLERWARSVSRDNITVVPLRHGQGDLYALERFLAFLGMDPVLAAGLAEDRKNISPPVGLIEPMRFFKATLLAQGLRPSQALAHLTRFRQELEGRVPLPTRRFLQSLEQRRALLEAYSASNKRLADDYLGGEPVFDSHLEDDPASAVPLAEEAARLLAEYIVSDKGKTDLFKDRLRAKIRRSLRFGRAG
ncbi:hypothetical protein [Sulfitobacter sp.]|uniref:hypothetical protein n=1 Tax=Sulfitobacter sp. TaxID=1903071 RepID=UPI003002B2EE